VRDVCRASVSSDASCSFAVSNPGLHDAMTEASRTRAQR
jgi:hypothetical protein